MKLNERDRIWLACATDAEGSIGIIHLYRKYKGKEYSQMIPYFSISNTNKRFLNKVKRIVKWGQIQEKTRQFLLVNREKIREVLNCILNELIVKKEQAKLMLEYLDYCSIRRNSPSTKIDYDYYLKMRKLNVRSKKPIRPFKQASYKAIDLTKEELEDLYWVQGYSMARIAKLLGVSPTGVFYRFKKLGIKSKPVRKR